MNWSYDESLERSVGGRRYRSNFLIDTRLQLESEIALKILHEESNSTVEPHKKPLRRLGEGDYITKLSEIVASSTPHAGIAKLALAISES